MAVASGIAALATLLFANPSEPPSLRYIEFQEVLGLIMGAACAIVATQKPWSRFISSSQEPAKASSSPKDTSERATTFDGRDYEEQKIVVDKIVLLLVQGKQDPILKRLFEVRSERPDTPKSPSELDKFHGSTRRAYSGRWHEGIFQAHDGWSRQNV